MKYENSVKSKNKPFSVRIGSFRSRVETYMQFSYILMIKKNSESQQKIQVFLLNKTKAVKRQKQIFELNVGSLGLWLEPYKMTKIRHGAVCNGF